MSYPPPPYPPVQTAIFQHNLESDLAQSNIDNTQADLIEHMQMDNIDTSTIFVIDHKRPSEQNVEMSDVDFPRDPGINEEILPDLDQTSSDSIGTVCETSDKFAFSDAVALHSLSYLSTTPMQPQTDPILLPTSEIADTNVPLDLLTDAPLLDPTAAQPCASNVTTTPLDVYALLRPVSQSILNEDDRTKPSVITDPLDASTFNEGSHSSEEHVNSLLPILQVCTQLRSSSPVRSSSPLPPSSPILDSAMVIDIEDDHELSILDRPEISSSPANASTPDLAFSSSPVHTSSFETPPTSSPRRDSPDVRSSPSRGTSEWTQQLRHAKRIRSATDTEESENSVLKRQRQDVNKPPQPLRQTVAFQRVQQAKLRTAFRSPVTLTTKDSRQQLHTKKFDSKSEVDVEVTREDVLPPAELVKKTTTKAAAQFKSPFSSRVGLMTREVSAAPNVQALQRRLQLLKRAIKIRNDGDEAKLTELVSKWTNVGREVAWEVWTVVKDSVVVGHSPAFNKSDWDVGDKQTNGFGDSWGWREPERVAEDVGEKTEVRNDTMGTMLRQLKIDPETLGWDEEEGDFVAVQ